MTSNIAEILGLKYEPVAILLTETKPDDAIQFKEGKFNCVMLMLIAAARGKQCIFDRNTFGCPGGGTGLGFGNQYKNFPGGEQGLCYFLSTGINGWGLGRRLAKLAKPLISKDNYESIIFGEGYFRTPELVSKFLECLPIIDIPYKYVLFKPLDQVDFGNEIPATVVFLANMDQLSALVILANYNRGHNENVTIPMAAGCQCIGIYPFREASLGQPRAVIGLADLSARIKLKRHLSDDIITFAVPLNMFQELEANIPGSFLKGNTWNELIKIEA